MLKVFLASLALGAVALASPTTNQDRPINPPAKHVFWPDYAHWYDWIMSHPYRFSDNPLYRLRWQMQYDAGPCAGRYWIPVEVNVPGEPGGGDLPPH